MSAFPPPAMDKRPIKLARISGICPRERGPFSALLLAAAILASAAAAPDRNLADLSIEELMNESVTSVSRKAERLGDAAAAIAVLSQDDLQRSGATTLMEALRLVPGVNVARVNSRSWAVSARGFNSVYSNKLLVLVDGRAVYSPLFAGVFWDLQQVMLEDVDRIEVIRGPGATVWGANAVNGVINVVTRSARDTQGGVITGGGGDRQVFGAVRYGGQSGPATFYRVFASWRKDEAFPSTAGAAAGPGWQGRHGGWRIDHYPAADRQVTWQTEIIDMKQDDGAASALNIHTLGRWTRRFSERSGVEVQAYLDRTVHREATQAEARSNTVDLSAQQTFALGPRQDVVWGGGYRYVDSRINQTMPAIQVRNDQLGIQLFNVFFQDEFRIVPDRLTLTAGAKLEHNGTTGWELQPSVRAMFKPSPTSTLWAAASQAVRTPSAVEDRDLLGFPVGAPFTGPDGRLYLPTLIGNGHPRSEVLRAYEAGYRAQPSRAVSVDLALFYNVYRDLIGIGSVQRLVPGSPLGVAEIPLLNVQSARAYGGELALTVSPADSWRLKAGFSQLRVRMRGAAVVDPASAPSSPRSQISLRSSHALTARLSLDLEWRRVSALPTVAAYNAADFRLAYQWTDRLELSLVGQNLFDPEHPELGQQQATATSEMPRQFHGQATWRF